MNLTLDQLFGPAPGFQEAQAAFAPEPFHDAQETALLDAFRAVSPERRDEALTRVLHALHAFA